MKAISGRAWCTFALYFKVGMTRLSVNVNKIATLRNARGGQNQCGGGGQAHPGVWGGWDHRSPAARRRRITYQDVHDLREVVTQNSTSRDIPATTS